MQYGKFYRLKGAETSNQCAWQVVSEDQKEAVVSVVTVAASAQPAFTKTKLQGLDADLVYEETTSHQQYGGDELMQLGLYDQLEAGDYQAQMYHFKAIN